MKAGNIAPPVDVLALHLRIMNELQLVSNMYLNDKTWSLRDSTPGIILLTGSIDIVELEAFKNVVEKYYLLYHLYPKGFYIEITFFVRRCAYKSYSDEV
mgnify:CR=1 FL=1